MQLQIGIEYVLEFDTSWEAEAWAEAIAESREALVRAAAERRWECVGRLLRSGRLPAAREANGRGALHYACGHGDYATVMALLEAGTPVCVAGASHRTHRIGCVACTAFAPACAPRLTLVPRVSPPLTRRPPSPVAPLRPSQTTPAGIHRPLPYRPSHIRRTAGNPGPISPRSASSLLATFVSSEPSPESSRRYRKSSPAPNSMLWPTSTQPDGTTRH
jgi:ankyrin repeat protein